MPGLAKLTDPPQVSWGSLGEGVLRSKMSLKTKIVIKIHFIRTNRIQDDDVNHKGKICKNKWREKEKTIFSYRIFDISHYGFTQILILGTHLMHNFIPHPTHTNNA